MFVSAFSQGPFTVFVRMPEPQNSSERSIVFHLLLTTVPYLSTVACKMTLARKHPPKWKCKMLKLLLDGLLMFLNISRFRKFIPGIRSHDTNHLIDSVFQSEHFPQFVQFCYHCYGYICCFFTGCVPLSC